MGSSVSQKTAGTLGATLGAAAVDIRRNGWHLWEGWWGGRVSERVASLLDNGITRQYHRFS